MRSTSPCEIMWCCADPKPTPANSSVMSRKRTDEPFSKYSFVPSLDTRLVITTSSKSNENFLLELSKISFTSARPSRAEDSEPLKIRSSPFLPLKDFIDCSPRTQRRASATLDLPEPFGPTIAVTGVGNSKTVDLPNDLNPESIKLFSE